MTRWAGRMEPTAFQLEHRGPRQFDVWRHPAAVPSAIGDVGLEVIVDLDARPDAEMCDALRELARFAAERGSELRAAIHAHYSAFCRKDPAWVLECGVPLALTDLQVVDYVRFASACVSRRRDDLAIKCYFHIRPQWDEEHDIFLGLTDNGLAPLDE